MDSLTIEPLSEAFGQNLETINVTTPMPMKNSDENRIITAMDKIIPEVPAKTPAPEIKIDVSEYSTTTVDQSDPTLYNRRLLNIVNKDNGQEVGEDMETIIAKDVEQGKCASFKKMENNNEKRSVNEPKYTPVS